MSHPTFCRKCGTPLKPQSQFCPKCGKVVTTILPPITRDFQEPQLAQPQYATPSQSSDKLWGIDKRFIIIAFIVLILILPIFPRDKVIYVDGQTTTTSTYQSTYFVTSYQPYSSPSQTQISVYVGTLQVIYQQYYGYWGSWRCYRWGRQIICPGWGGGWPSYYYNTVTIEPSQMVTQISVTQGAYGLMTITLYRNDGSIAGTYSNVVSNNLQQTGTAYVQTTANGISTYINTLSTPQESVSTVPCQSCIPQHTTEHVSLLQILLGL